MPDPKRGHRPVDAHDQRIPSGALGKIASTIGCRSGLGAVGLQFLPFGRPVGRDGDLFDRFGHASHAFGDPAGGVTIKRQIDEGVYQGGIWSNGRLTANVVTASANVAVNRSGPSASITSVGAMPPYPAGHT